MRDHRLTYPDIDAVIVGASTLPVEDDDIADVFEGCDLVLSVGDIDLARISRLLPPGIHCLYVLGDHDNPKTPSPPNCHLLSEKGASVFGWGIVGISGGSEFDDGPNAISEEEAKRLARLIEGIPDYDILITHAPPPTVEADTGEAPQLLALQELYAVAPPLYHFYGHSEPGGDAEQIWGALAVGICGLTRARLRRPGTAASDDPAIAAADDTAIAAPAAA